MVFMPPNFAYVIVFKNALANMQFSQLHLKTTVYASLLFMQNLKVKQGGGGGGEWGGGGLNNVKKSPFMFA